MPAVVLIPARYQASRFPGKPLASIAGVPMLRRVVEGARSAKRVRDVIVATDDPRIADACAAFGVTCRMTSPRHATGTDRIAEVAAGISDEVIVNVQGDEPLVEGFVIDALVEALDSDPEVPMATLAHPAEPAAREDPNRVKVVVDQRGRALYFSRSPIPGQQDPAAGAPATLQHVGLYAYRRPFLMQLVRLAQTPLERAEALEQLRALEHGFPVRVALVEGWCSMPVDVPQDVLRVEARLREAGRC